MIFSLVHDALGSRMLILTLTAAFTYMLVMFSITRIYAFLEYCKYVV